MKRVCLVACWALLCGVSLHAQLVGDVLGVHDMSPNGISPVQGGSSSACLYCHAPHSGAPNTAPLWNQALSPTASYSLYSSTTLQNSPTQPIPGGASSLCLSCHDGTVAKPGNSIVGGNRPMLGSMNGNDNFGSNLQTSHPILFADKPPKDAAHLVASLHATGDTTDPQKKVELINGTIECTTCHEPHNQEIDPISLNFLVRDSSSGGLCLSCHETNARTVNGKSNPLENWSTGVHATAGNSIASGAKIGSYPTVAQSACLSCHTPHSANGMSGLLRGAVPPPANMDAYTQACYACHSGANLNPAIPNGNVYAEFAKTGHPFPSTGNDHDVNEAALVPVGNRHATCADCHNGHTAQPTTTFSGAPGIRPSQAGVTGIDPATGNPVLPAVNQYQSCLRCHGSTAPNSPVVLYGYAPLRAVSAANPMDVIPQFSTIGTSSHPVMHPSNSAWLQPSLRAHIIDFSEVAINTRPLTGGVGTQILCTDCHNSDDSRESGGAGPAGPHGSTWTHILERRYVMSQVGAGGPGSQITNPQFAPSVNSGNTNPGPYALCGKCHDLTNILSDASFAPASGHTKGGHFTHVSDQGISCSVCHAAHGNGNLSSDISGDRLVNFDLLVVAQNGSAPVSYVHGAATNTCTLMCHDNLTGQSVYHNSDGTVTKVP